MSDLSTMTVDLRQDFWSPGLLDSPWICCSRGSHSRRRGGGSQEAGRGQTKLSISSLFEDLDPDSSPLLKHLERKRKSGAKLTENDFTESFPLFKKKMEKEFDEITEKFKRLSIENPDIHDEEESEICRDIVIKSTEIETKKVTMRVSQENHFNINFKSFIITNLLLQLTLEGLNLLM